MVEHEEKFIKNLNLGVQESYLYQGQYFSSISRLSPVFSEHDCAHVPPKSSDGPQHQADAVYNQPATGCRTREEQVLKPGSNQGQALKALHFYNNMNFTTLLHLSLPKS